VERDDFIATSHENIVIDAGFTVGAAWSDCASAGKWLSTNNPDAAIVDVKLQDKSCVKLVEKLSMREIPFLAISSHSADTQGVDPVFRSVPWLEKPVTSAGLHLALRSIL
jgi:two-component SAPR family response regulator